MGSKWMDGEDLEVKGGGVMGLGLEVPFSLSRSLSLLIKDR